MGPARGSSPVLEWSSSILDPKYRLLGLFSSCLNTDFHTHGSEVLHKEVPKERSPCATTAMASHRDHNMLILIMLILQANNYPNASSALCLVKDFPVFILFPLFTFHIYLHMHGNILSLKSLARQMLLMKGLLSQLQLHTDCEQAFPKRRKTLHPTSS